jgi:predicted GH43/DUF377 family glycosyl hydrolase
MISNFIILLMGMIYMEDFLNNSVDSKRIPTMVPQEIMDKIYEEVKTPFKYGIILEQEGDTTCDCPSVFRFNNRWYLVYVSFDGVCYETYLAESNDLLNWKKLGKILEAGNSGWDSLQNAGFIALQDTKWGGSNELLQYDEKYWMSYVGGMNKGYETPPLSIGIANTDKPDQPIPWKRIPDNPVLTSSQDDVRHFENEILYKSNIIIDDNQSLGYLFIMYYNAKSNDKVWTEKIGMAVSNDMIHWKRYGNDAVVKHNTGITGDAQIVKIDNMWVMFYFGAHYKPRAFDQFACSYDLINWTYWNGNDLISPSEFYDQEYAHKPWVIKYNGIVYHFYCAVGNKGRSIALATSKYVGKSPLN